MKKLLVYSAIAVASLTGCSESFLTIEPAGSVSQTTLATYDGVEMVAAGAYALLYNGGMNGSLANPIFGDCMGGDANKGSDPSDQADWGNLDAFLIVDNNSYISNVYKRRLEGVHRSNELLHIAGLADLSGKTMDGKSYDVEIQAEARFLKAIHQFDLIRIFGGAVPYVTLEDYQSSTDPMVANVDESGNFIYVWDKVIEDLKYAYENLPVDRKQSGQLGRATKTAAAAYLGKVYLYMSSKYDGTNGTTYGKYVDDAIFYLKEVIFNGVNAAGKPLELVDSYRSLWDNHNFTTDNTTEAIFEIQQMVSGTQTSTNAIIATYYPAFAGAIKGSGWGFYCPSYDLAHSFMVDANGLPLANYRSESEKIGYMSKLNPLDESTIITDLTIPVDPRIDAVLGRFNVPYYEWGTPSAHAKWIRNFSNCGAFLNKKTIETSGGDGVTTTPGTSSKNFHLMRLGEVYLMYAECNIIKGEYNEALTYINKLRKRAGNDPLPVKDSSYTLTVDGKVVKSGMAGTYSISQYTTLGDEASAWEALKREYRAEMGMEGQRWFNLARWGEIGKDLTDFVTYEAKAFPGNPLKYNKSYNNDWVTLPFPFAEMNVMNGKLVQKNAWKQK